MRWKTTKETGELWLNCVTGGRSRWPCCLRHRSEASRLRNCGFEFRWGHGYTRWFKYDRDYLCVNKSQFVPVIFEPPCTSLGFVVRSAGSVLCDELITRLEESYRKCVSNCVCSRNLNKQVARARAGLWLHKKQKLVCINKLFPDNVTHY